MHVDDHRLYLPDARRSERLGETRVVDVEEVVVQYDIVRYAAVPLWTSTRTERRMAALVDARGLQQMKHHRRSLYGSLLYVLTHKGGGQALTYVEAIWY